MKFYPRGNFSTQIHFHLKLFLSYAQPKVFKLRRGTNYHFHYKVTTHSTFFCRLLETAVEIVFLAINFAMNIIEGLAPQYPAARAADEARGVVKVAHGLARLPGPTHLLPASMAHTCQKRGARITPLVFQVILPAGICLSQRLNLCNNSL